MSVGIGVIAAVGVAGVYACGGAKPLPPPPPTDVLGAGSAPNTAPDIAVASAAPAASSAAPATTASGSPATVLLKDLHAPNAIALDRAHVYWVDEL
ncbi:MAG TPA: hypothetical protein VHS09_10900, partial [Polyangiaceae bacterium]|nr:hypothetical protein [Polyangiaceae bacterium]